MPSLNISLFPQSGGLSLPVSLSIILGWNILEDFTGTSSCLEGDYNLTIGPSYILYRSPVLRTFSPLLKVCSPV